MRTVFVTGAAHGIGLAAARRFARAGDHIFLYDRNETRLPEAVASVAADRTAAGRVGDVRSREDVRAALDACEAELGPVDVCLNQAGIGPSTHSLALDEAEWDDVLSINLTGVLRVGQEVARRMPHAVRGSS